MKIKILLSFFLLLAAIGFVGTVSAEVYQYKWKGENGEMHYTDRPPAQGIKFEKIRVKSHVSNQSSQSFRAKAEAEKDKPETEADAKYNGWRKENCKRATQNLDILENAGRISQDDGQGGTRLMSEEEKQAKIKDMTAQKDKYCADKAE